MPQKPRLPSKPVKRPREKDNESKKKYAKYLNKFKKEKEEYQKKVEKQIYKYETLLAEYNRETGTNHAFDRDDFLSTTSASLFTTTTKPLTTTQPLRPMATVPKTTETTAPMKHLPTMPSLADINSDVSQWIEEATAQSERDEKILKNEVFNKLVTAKQELNDKDDEEVDKWTVFPSGIKLPSRPIFREPGPKESKLLYNSYVKVESANLEIWYIEYYNIIHTIDEGLDLIEPDMPVEKHETLVNKFDTLIETLTPSDENGDDEEDLPPADFGSRWREENGNEEQQVDGFLSAAWAKQTTKPSGLGRFRDEENDDEPDAPYYTAQKSPIFHAINNHVPGLMTANLPGNDGAGDFDIDLAKLKVFKDLPDSIIKYMTPQAKHALLETALKELDIKNVRTTWTKPLAMIVDEDGELVSQLDPSQHAWAFPEFVERGGAMQEEEVAHVDPQLIANATSQVLATTTTSTADPWKNPLGQ